MEGETSKIKKLALVERLNLKTFSGNSVIDKMHF